MKRVERDVRLVAELLEQLAAGLALPRGVAKSRSWYARLNGSGEAVGSTQDDCDPSQQAQRDLLCSASARDPPALFHDIGKGGVHALTITAPNRLERLRADFVGGLDESQAHSRAGGL